MAIDLLKNILDDGFLENLAKSADLYKIGTNTVLDPEEIRIGLKVVPRAVMSLLISELAPMEINAHKDIQLPFGKVAYVRVNKNAADDFTGSVYNDNKLVYDFKNRSIPGLGIILLSTFELYDVEELSKPHKHEDEVEKRVQKLIDERMELHSLVGRVVEEKLAQREAIHKIMMAKLSSIISDKAATPISTKTLDLKPEDVAKKEVQKSGDIKGVHGATYTGAAKDIASAGEKSLHGQSTAHAFKNTPRTGFSADKPSEKEMHRQVLGEIRSMPKPNLPKSEDMAKKEKGSPLKAFLERKKKPREYKVEMMKSETFNCPDCGQVIFGGGVFSCCLCYGQDQNKKIWIKKSEKDNNIQIKFSRSWDPENIQMLLDALRRRNV